MLRASIVVLSALTVIPPTIGNKNELLELFSSKGASVSAIDSRIETLGLNRIVGGNDADPTLYPFFSLIEIAKQFNDSDVTDICGGSLVAPDIVLTAAHCFAEGTVLNTTVFVNNTATNNLTGYEYLRDVVDVVIHPEYEIATFKNDIALLMLSSPVTEVTPVPLNSDSSLPIDGEDLQVIGMGLLKEQSNNDDGVFPDYLQVATVQSISVAVCAAAYANTPDGENIPVDKALQFCAAAPGKDACAADSGGPIVRTSGSSSLLIGTVSFGYGCAVPVSSPLPLVAATG
jgi:secreted trypsin-like serine protease